MGDKRLIVAIAGAGDSARYLVEQCLREHLTVFIISRAVGTRLPSSKASVQKLTWWPVVQPREWFDARGVQVHVSDYTYHSILDILNNYKATVLVSLLHDNNPEVMVGGLLGKGLNEGAQTDLLPRFRHKQLC